AQGGAPERDLERGRVRGVADDPGGERVGRPVGRARRPDADGSQAGPAGVLHEEERSGRDHLDAPPAPGPRRAARRGTRARPGGARARRGRARGDHPADRHEPHARTRRDERRGVPVDVEHRRARAPEEPPPARGLARVDGREVARERDGPPGDAGPRRLEARRRDAGVDAGQVHEAGREAPERGLVLAPGVPCDDLLGARARPPGDVVEVLPVVPHGDLDERARRWGVVVPRAAYRVARPGERPTDVAGARAPPEDAPGRGDDVDHPRRYVGEERAVHRAHGREVREVDQQGRLAEPAHGPVGARHDGRTSRAPVTASTKGRTSTPASWSAVRSAPSSPTAPGVSEWTHTESAWTRTDEPSAAPTVPVVTSRTTRRATSSPSCATAPGGPRGTSSPEGRQPRSANASRTVGWPAASANRSTAEPGSPTTGSVGS